MRRTAIRTVLAGLLAGTLSSCGGGGGSPAPTSPTSQNAVVTATATRISGNRQAGGGFIYEVVIQVRETGGAAVTINSIDLTFVDGATPFGSTHFDSPMSGDNNQVPANGSGTSKTLTSTDDNASDPYASKVLATVRYTDAKSTAGSTTVSGDVPALPAVPAPQLFSLSGSVLEVPGNFPVRSALVEVKTGSNAGAAVVTDASGKFTFSSLASGTFTLSISKSEYDTAQQTVTLANNATLTVNVRKSATPQPPAPQPQPSLCAPASAACGTATARCNDGTLSCSQNRSGTCSSHSGVQCFICPGLLCNGVSTFQDLPFTPASTPYTPVHRIRQQ